MRKRAFFMPSVPVLYIACLCAQWCGTCRDYAPLFAALAHDFPQATLQWVDVEDEAELVDPLEVDNFPTLLIACGGTVQFFGTVTPHAQTLHRLVQAAVTDASGASDASGTLGTGATPASTAAPPHPAAQALAGRLLARLESRPDPGLHAA
jgi:thiol-disulfide isomerase/thioredoxin